MTNKDSIDRQEETSVAFWKSFHKYVHTKSIIAPDEFYVDGVEVTRSEYVQLGGFISMHKGNDNDYNTE